MRSSLGFPLQSQLKSIALVGIGLWIPWGISSLENLPSPGTTALASVASSPDPAHPNPAHQIPPGNPQTTPPNPAQAAQYRGQGLALRQQGDWAGAIAALQQAVTLDPSHTDGRVLLGWTYHLAGDRPQALALLRSAVQQDPVHVPALNALGIVQLVQGQRWAAVATHTQAALLDPSNEIAFYNLSLAWQGLGFSSWAMATAETAIALEPSNPHPQIAWALAAEDWGDRAGSLAQYEQVLALDSRYSDRTFLQEDLAAAGFSPPQIDRVTQTLFSLP